MNNEVCLTFRADDIINYAAGMGHALPPRVRVKWSSLDEKVSIYFDPRDVEYDSDGNPTNLHESKTC